MKRHVSLLLVYALLVSTVMGQSLNPRGIAPNGTVFAMKRKGPILYVGGGFNKVGVHTGGSAFYPNGSILPDVGRAYVFGEVYVSVPDGQGGRYMGGDFTKVNKTDVSNLVHILPNETVDPNFKPLVDGSVEAIAVFNDTILFAGNFQTVNGLARSNIASWDINQASLTSWAPQINGPVYSLQYFNGYLYAGGNFSRVEPYDQVALAKLDILTGESVYFPSPNAGIVYDIQEDQGLLYTAGNYTGASGYYTGQAAEVSIRQDIPIYEFPATDGTIQHIISDGNGGWFMAGSFFNVGGVSQRRLAHILPNYQVDPAFTPNPNSTVNAMAWIRDTLFFGGSFTTVDGQPRQRLAAYDVVNNSLVAWNPGASGTVNTLETYGDALLVGGTFSYVDSLYSPRLGMLSRLDGTAKSINSPSSGDIRTMEVSGNTLYVGGSFNGAVGYPTGGVARLTAEDSLPPWPFAEFGGTVETIISDGQGGWYVGGSFFSVNNGYSGAIRRLAHVLPNNTIDPTFNLSPNSTVDKLYLVNDTLFIGGNFTQIDGQVRNRMAAYDVQTGLLTSFNPDVGGRVYDMGVFRDTMLIVGAFTTVGGQTRERVAMLDGQTGALLPFSMNINSTVYSLSWNDTMMYIGGQFSQINGQARPRLAGILRGSGTLGALNIGPNSTIQDLEIHDSLLYIGGNFTSVDGQGRSRLAAININTVSVNNWNPSPNNTVNVLRVFNDTMMVGGNFTQIGGQAIERLAKIDRFSGNPYSFKPNPNGTVNTLVINGKEVLAGGAFQTVRAKSRSRVMAIDMNTLEPTSFAPSVNGTVEDLNLWVDTMLFVGNFTQVNGLTRQRFATAHRQTGQTGPLHFDIDNTVLSVARWNDTMMFGGRFDHINGIPQTHLAAIHTPTGNVINWNPEPSNDVLTIAHVSNRTAVGGLFTTFKPKTRNRAMAIDMLQDSIHAWNPDLGGAFFSSGNCLHIEPTQIFIGGRFTSAGDSTATNLVAVDKLTGTATGQHIPINGTVWDVTTKGDSVLFVGEFLDVDAVFRLHAAGINRQNWELNNWKPELEADGFLLENNGGELLVGGEFFMTNIAERKNAYAINLATQELLPWNPNPNNIITDIETDRTGEKIYVAGGFSQIAGDPVAYFAALNPLTGANIPGWDFDISSTVYAIDVNPQTESIYIGGRFTDFGGQVRNHLAAVDSSGNLLPLQVDFDGDIRSLAFRDTMLYISGDFDNANNTPRNKIAAISQNGQLMDWEPSHDVAFFNSMGEVVASPDKIFLQGSFDEVNGEKRSRVAAVGPVKGVLDNWNPQLKRGTSSFSVSTIYPIGSDVFVGGTFTSAGGTPVSGMARFNIETGVIQPPILRFPFSTLTAFESFEDKLFFAGDYDSVNNTYQPNLASIQFEPSTFSPRVRSVSPSQGGNTGDVTLKIFGYGFKPGARVILRKAGLPDIVSLDSATLVTTGRQIQAAFILRGAAVGFRDVVVEIPGDTTFMIPNGFEIVPGQEPDVWVDLVGPTQLRNRFRARYVINYGNKSNIDAVGVPVWILLPKSFDVEAFSVKIARPRDSTQAFYDQIPRFFDIDSIGNEAFDGRLYVFTIPKIPANSSGQFSFRFRPLKTGPFRYKVWISKPMFGSPLKRLAGECIDEILVDLLGLIPGAGCALGVMEATLCPMLDYADPESGFGSGDYIMDYGAGLAETVVTCALDASLIGGVIADIIKIILTAKNNEEIIEKCNEQFGPEEDDEGGGDVNAALDPNNKVGLQGEGGLGWLNTNQVFSYLINFENVDTATASAQLVTIYDTLDKQVFDLSTFELGFFTLADSLYKIPPGLQEYEELIDLRPRLPMYVQFSAKLDQLSGSVTWRFESIDTTTLEWLNDPILGLLPPNTDSISGMGSVFYTVRTRRNLTSGTTLTNRADIVFDFNDPIITDSWINTADNDLPQSRINALPDTTWDTAIPLTWSGRDLGSGIRYYNIFYSKDGDQWLMAGYQVSDTMMIFEADPGASYRFYSIAYDTARNRERIPMTHDAQTYVPLSVSRESVIQPFDVSIVPNPNRGTFQLDFSSPIEAQISVEISNSLGQQVYLERFRLSSGRSAKEISLELPAGIYNVLIRTGTGSAFRKLEIR